MGVSNWELAWTLLMPFGLILYYFYRKKYKDQPVSSILYWRHMMKEMQASPYLKKLQHHLLFYLQFIALLLFVLTLLNPYLRSEGLEGGEFVFVMDTSASMLAGSPSQLEKQKTLMKELTKKAQGKPVTIINAGSIPEILIHKEQSEEKLIQIIDDISANYESAQMEKTMLFAETLIDNEDAVIHVFTDFLDTELIADKTEAAYIIHANDEKLSNISIRQFGVAQGESEDRAVIQLFNDSDRAITGLLELTGGEYEETVLIELAAGEEKLIPFDKLPKNSLWQASLEVDDDYVLDNQAFAYNNRAVDTAIIDNALHGLVAKGVESLEMKVNNASAEQLEEFPGIPVITNQSKLIEGIAPILLIGRNDEISFGVTGQVETTDHPLFTYAPMENVHVSSLYPGFEGFQTVATVSGEPFIQLSPQGDIIVLADIQATDWPLYPSFPLFLWSAVNELTGSKEYMGTFWPKEQRAVNLTSAEGEWEIFKGEEFQFTYIEGQGSFQAPKEPGIYRAISNQETKNFIVQLNNEEKIVTVGQNFSAGKTIQPESTAQHSSVILWLVLIILLLMLAEWEVYRRGFSSLR